MASTARDCQCTEDSSTMVIGKPSSGVNSQQASSVSSRPPSIMFSEQSLSKWKVTDLRQELSTRNINAKGTKVELIKKLLNSQGTIHHSQHSGEVKCKCGINHNDGRLLIECSGCLKWSHLLCYGLSQASAMNLDFSCNVCERIIVSLCPSLLFLLKRILLSTFDL